MRIACAILVLLAFPAHGAGYSVQGGRIHDPSGRVLPIRGINHFGFDSTILVPQYLWEMSWKGQIAQIKTLGFNAVRVPFVPDTLYNTTPVDELSFINPELNGDLRGKTSLQVLDLWMAEADRKGLYIVLDFHSVTRQGPYPHWFVSDPADYHLTYNGQAYTQANWIRDLKLVAARYANNPHFLGVDLYNEPNGKVRWGPGDPNGSDPAYYWKRAAEAAAAAVLQANPRLLVFVQGIAGNFDGIEDSDLPMDWGEDLQPQVYQPLDIPASKLVLSPHTYGPDVFMKSTFSDPAYPHNLADDWETLFGQLHPAYALVIGEWGGRYGEGPTGQQDVIWQNAFVQYLKSRNMRDTFYWAYTPNSHDAGGILDDDLQVRQEKMALLRDLWGVERPADSAKAEGGGGALGLGAFVLFVVAVGWRRWWRSAGGGGGRARRALTSSPSSQPDARADRRRRSPLDRARSPGSRTGARWPERRHARRRRLALSGTCATWERR
jgi:aryl-phospho-beta-D-glucosidase BglC (GH1 family)